MPDYDELIEKLHDAYGSRALAVLSKIAEACKAEGFAIESEPHDMSADDYRWSMVVRRPADYGEVGEDQSPERIAEQVEQASGTDDLVDISIEIAEEREYEGDGWGVNFGLSIVEYGGRILGGLAPFNYTDLCWVDARSAERVEQRWKIIEDADMSTVPALANDRTGVTS